MKIVDFCENSSGFQLKLQWFQRKKKPAGDYCIVTAKIVVFRCGNAVNFTAFASMYINQLKIKRNQCNWAIQLYLTCDAAEKYLLSIRNSIEYIVHYFKKIYTYRDRSIECVLSSSMINHIWILLKMMSYELQDTIYSNTFIHHIITQLFHTCIANKKKIFPWFASQPIFFPHTKK